MVEMAKAEGRARFDIWSSIQKEKEENGFSSAAEWTLPPLLRRSSSLMSQQSLELCTENLGSETGSDGFSSADELDSFFSQSFKTSSFEEIAEAEEGVGRMEMQRRKKEMIRSNHNSFIGRASPPPRTFPPPLSSSSIQMKAIRRDGRLILEAISAPSHNFLHAERHGGRLLLSFINPDFHSNTSNHLPKQNSSPLEEVENEEEDDEVEPIVEADEEEEVQVEESGTKVDVKVTTQPQVVNDAKNVILVLSSFVINKFAVGSTPTAAGDPAATASAKQSIPAMTAAADAKSPLDGFLYNYLRLCHLRPWGSQKPPPPPPAAAVEAKLLFASKRKSREELLRDVRQWSDLRRPLIVLYIRETLLHCYLLLSWTEIIK